MLKKLIVGFPNFKIITWRSRENALFSLHLNYSPPLENRIMTSIKSTIVKISKGKYNIYCSDIRVVQSIRMIPKLKKRETEICNSNVLKDPVNCKADLKRKLYQKLLTQILFWRNHYIISVLGVKTFLGPIFFTKRWWFQQQGVLHSHQIV